MITPRVILGAPGCGKTRTLADMWVPQAAERFGAENAVIFSLTKAAANEIARRVDLPKENVGTLHALCYRGLERPRLADEEIADWNQSHPEFALTVKGGDADEPDVETRALALR